MRLFNTLAGRVEDFEAGDDVSLYVCGVTPYDTTHLGHARTYLVFDVLIRQLIHAGKKVSYVQNITDVDDSIVRRAAEVDESYKSLGDRYTAIYMDDVAALGMIPARAYPRATEAIPHIQELIRRLLATGHAYRAGAEVYFNVGGLPSYGELSRLSRTEMLEIERHQEGSTVTDERKRDPLDVLLWRSVNDGGPAWDSPWGAGRPGWHIECSTLALANLGHQVDIHGGGVDLVFPHHEAEIAQSEAVTGVRPFARFWVHVGLARLGGQKMAKSMGNMVFVRDLLARYTPDAVRLYLLSVHYRRPLDFDESELARWPRAARRLSQAAHSRVVAPRAGGFDERPFEDAVEQALNDDLDTPTAIHVVEELADRLIDAGPAAPYRGQRALRRLASRLGLNLEG